MRILLLLGVIGISVVCGGRLTIQGSHFYKDGQQVFLSGANLAWIKYAHEFGNHQFANVKARYDQVFRELREAGGNSMRVWVHYESESSPNFDNTGTVIGLDQAGTFISDFKEMLNLAAQHHILVFPCLWNAAINTPHAHDRLLGLIRDTRKLQSYIDKALKPLVSAVGTHPALGGWDLMNEPEGILTPNHYHAEKCFDSRHMANSGMGWSDKSITYDQILRFFNWQAAGIKDVDPGALVTIGQWTGQVVTDNWGQTDHYKDDCLIKAGGRPHGTLNFYSVHAYSGGSANKFSTYAPFVHSYGDYGVKKPIVVGEFRTSQGGGMSNQQLFEHAYSHGYAGAWSWEANDTDPQNQWDRWVHQREGIATLKGKTNPATQFNV